MFTGIIEAEGTLVDTQTEGENKTFIIQSPISHELKVDQSLSHNGVCLTVIEVKNNSHTVTAVRETLHRSNLGLMKKGDRVNLERAMLLGSRLDGHMVQGHVDSTGVCIDKQNQNGSWLFHFTYELSEENILVQKGSVCVNGVSLTVVNPIKGEFAVAVIPYTYEHTNFGKMMPGDKVNIEFDILGKYITKLFRERNGN